MYLVDYSLHSHLVVDNIIERLTTSEAIVRLGHPCRILPQVISTSLDLQIKSCDGGLLVNDIRKEIDAHLTKLQSGGRIPKQERRAIYQELKHLRKDCRERERNVVQSLVRNAKVVFSTLCGAGGRKLFQETFDVVLVDEVSQSTEAECWIAALKAEKLVLVGDPCQLPPTIKCPEAARKGLEKTLFDRLQSQYGDRILRMLTIQYRMHKQIMDWSNQALYNGKLVAAEAVKNRKLYELPGVQETEETSETLLLIDTAGCDMPEAVDEDNESKWNEGEAKLCAEHVERLMKAGLHPSEIAIITPYNAQVQQLLNLLPKEKYPQLEIGSVDGFQGREKEAIVLTLVRSNEKGEVGFLSETRRLNVALTRAKRHVCLVCDTDTIRRDEQMKTMVEYFQDNADVQYAYTYQQ